MKCSEGLWLFLLSEPIPSHYGFMDAVPINPFSRKKQTHTSESALPALPSLRDSPDTSSPLSGGEPLVLCQTILFHPHPAL